jgi:hypothetical protein
MKQLIRFYNTVLSYRIFILILNTEKKKKKKTFSAIFTQIEKNEEI